MAPFYSCIFLMVDPKMLLSRLKVLGLVSCILAFFFLLGFIYFKINVANYIQAHPDNFDCANCAVVVITGGSGRIQVGLDLFERKCGQFVLISGVAPGVSKSMLIGNNIDPRKVFMGYLAQNTEMNAQEAKIFAMLHHIKSIVVVTNTLHVPRAEFLFRALVPECKIQFHAVQSDYTWYAQLTEYSKYIATVAKYYLDAAYADYHSYLRSVALFWQNG